MREHSEGSLLHTDLFDSHVLWSLIRHCDRFHHWSWQEHGATDAASEVSSRALGTLMRRLSLTHTVHDILRIRLRRGVSMILPEQVFLGPEPCIQQKVVLDFLLK